MFHFQEFPGAAYSLYVFYKHASQNKHNKNLNYTRHTLQIFHPILTAPKKATIHGTTRGIFYLKVHFGISDI